MQGIARPLERHKDHLWSLVTVSFEIQADFLFFLLVPVLASSVYCNREGGPRGGKEGPL